MKPLEVDEVLHEETEYLKKRRIELDGEQSAISIGDDLIGIASSGGGIRSATINLGFLKVLTERNVLQKVDYHSTVSGGGYAGAYLQGTLLSTGTYDSLFDSEKLGHLKTTARKYMAPGGVLSKIKLFQAYFTLFLISVLVLLLLIYKPLYYLFDAFGHFVNFNSNSINPETTVIPIVFAFFVGLPFVFYLAMFIRGKKSPFFTIKIFIIPLLVFSFLYLSMQSGVNYVSPNHSQLFLHSWSVFFTLLLIRLFLMLSNAYFTPSYYFEFIAILLFIGIYIIERTTFTLPNSIEGWTEFATCLSFFILIFIVGLWANPSQFNPGKYYETQLSDAFLNSAPYSSLKYTPISRLLSDALPEFEKKTKVQQGAIAIALTIEFLKKKPKIIKDKKNIFLPPFPLINTCLNLSAPFIGKNHYSTDYFIITPLHIGSPATGYLHSNDDKYLEMTLPVAMRISGAAINAGMGTYSNKLVGFGVTAFNLSLGQWVRNPNSPNWRYTFSWMPEYYLRDLISWRGINKGLVNISDGGHIENLGAYELLRRRCKLVICVDASEDPMYSFEDLKNLMRRSRSELGFEIRFRNGQNPEIAMKPDLNGLSNAVYSIGDVYDINIDNNSNSPGNNNIVGTFIYVKSAITREMGFDFPNQYIFPHHPTSNQFFSEIEWENYFKLGEHLANELFRSKALVEFPNRSQIIDYFNP